MAGHSEPAAVSCLRVAFALVMTVRIKHIAGILRETLKENIIPLPQKSQVIMPVLSRFADPPEASLGCPLVTEPSSVPWWSSYPPRILFSFSDSCAAVNGLPMKP